MNRPVKQDHEHRLTDYFAGMLVASENKLTMKLFGSKSALQKEKQRQLVTHTCVIHPCSNFRYVHISVSMVGLT